MSQQNPSSCSCAASFSRLYLLGMFLSITVVQSAGSEAASGTLSLSTDASSRPGGGAKPGGRAMPSNSHDSLRLRCAALSTTMCLAKTFAREDCKEFFRPSIWKPVPAASSFASGSSKGGGPKYFKDCRVEKGSCVGESQGENGGLVEAVSAGLGAAVEQAASSSFPYGLHSSSNVTGMTNEGALALRGMASLKLSACSREASEPQIA
mmetsp:Transcript_58355/g.103732  ORF Transcript_58355/g.103732 Transcript_58355/m.103732 type:complete len:208 (-) Transcript_58355:7-630(-)